VPTKYPEISGIGIPVFSNHPAPRIIRKKNRPTIIRIMIVVFAWSV